MDRRDREREPMGRAFPARCRAHAEHQQFASRVGRPASAPASQPSVPQRSPRPFARARLVIYRVPKTMASIGGDGGGVGEDEGRVVVP